MARNVRLFPAPEGPNTTPRSSSQANFTSSVKSRPLERSVLRISTSICMASARVSRLQQPAGSQQDRYAYDRSHHDEEIRHVVFPRLHCFIDGNRKGLGATGKAAGDHQRSAELAKRASKGEHGPSQDPAPRQRQRDTKKNLEFRLAVPTCCLLVLALDPFEGRACGLLDPRKRTDCRCNHRALPSKDQG